MLEAFPPEVMQYMLQYFKVPELGRIAQVSTTMNQAVNDVRLWINLYTAVEKSFPTAKVPKSVEEVKRLYRELTEYFWKRTPCQDKRSRALTLSEDKKQVSVFCASCIPLNKAVDVQGTFYFEVQFRQTLRNPPFILIGKHSIKRWGCEGEWWGVWLRSGDEKKPPRKMHGCGEAGNHEELSNTLSLTNGSCVGLLLNEGRLTLCVDGKQHERLFDSLSGLVYPAVYLWNAGDEAVLKVAKHNYWPP